jgi:hypothetical protein
VWISELDLGLSLGQGEYQGIKRLWLRWYDDQGSWILTEAEQERLHAQQAEFRANEAEARLESLMQRLRESGIAPDELLSDRS